MHKVSRPRPGCDIPVTDIDNYSKVESRQEMGWKLSTFLGTVTGDPHASILMKGGQYSPRHRPDKRMPHLHLRTAKNPYKVEVY